MEALLAFLSEQFLLNLALSLIHFIWQGALIAIVLWGILLIVPKNSFNWRYRFAVTALALCVIAPIYTFQFLSNSTDASIENSLIASVEATKTEDSLLTDELSEGNSELNADYSEYVSHFLILWLIGCALMLIKFVLELNNTFKLTKLGINPVSTEIEIIARQLADKYNLRSKIRILKSNKVNVPVVIGWLRPVILLPIAITIGLEKNHLELIIAHELAHIKRMDFAVNLLQSIVQIGLFYHPIVFWINKVIRDEREYICDQLAINVLGNDDNARISLAKALLGTEELREGNLSLVAVAASGGMLKHRISHILDSQYKPATSLRSIVVGFFVFMFSFAALSTTVNFSKEFSGEYEITGNEYLSDEVNLSFAPETKGSVNIQSTSIVPSQEFLEKSELGFALIQSNNEIDSESKDAMIIPAKVIDAKDVSNISRVPVLKVQNESNPVLLAENIVKASKSIKDPNVVPINLQSKSFKTISKELHADMSKSFSEQYSLPVSIPVPTRKRERVAILDLPSVDKLIEPKAIYTPYPKYPRRAWSRMTNQNIRVDFVIGPNGEVGSIKVEENADRDFTREIYRKLKKWRYLPATKAGVKVAHATTLDFSFEAPQKERIRIFSTGTRIPKN